MSRPRAGTGAAELRTLLLRVSRARREDFQVSLSRYAVERLLFRLSTSRHREAFLLKGAMLVATWTAIPYRATRDVDLLGIGDVTPAQLAEIVRELCALDGGDDGIEFDPASVRAEEIRGEERNGGVRVRLTGGFGGAVIPVQVDIGFGDAVVPAAEWMDYPTLLALPAPRVRAYSRYTVVSEKLEAVIALGLQNSRMKDFYDLWVLSRDFDFDGALLVRSVVATFARRNTLVPAELPAALSPEFGTDSDKLVQWDGFRRRGQLRESDAELVSVVDEVRRFAMPCFEAIRANRSSPGSWPAGGPWGHG